MTPFTFDTVPSVTLEWGCAGRLGQLLPDTIENRRILVVTDAGLHRSGVLATVYASLRASGYELVVFDEVVADPPEEIVLRAGALARRERIGLVLGLGGGSSLDVAKLAAVLALSDQPLAEMYGIGKVTGRRLPLIQIPTTAGTGSEVTSIAILTTGAATKMGVVSKILYADHVFLDAELTIGLPALHTAATGIDAMVHAIEAYTGRLRKNPVSDALAREALRLLAANIVTACTDASNRDAREAMLLGAMLAGQAFANSPVAAVHALAYPLGGHYHVPHGLSNALMLGPVLRFNAVAAAASYAELADLLIGPLPGGATDRAKAFIDFMETLMDRTGAPRRLRDVGVEESRLPLLARDALQQQRLLINNPVEITEADALALYQAAF